MRTILLLVAAAVAAALVVGGAGAASPRVGTLSVEGGKGQVSVEIKGNVIGRLANGTVRVTDLTPRDRFLPYVQGRKLKITRVNAKTTLYKGQSLRFRMLGGRSKIVVKGTGISVAAVGRGWAMLDAQRLLPDDPAGVYSLDGVDCSVEPLTCTPLPADPERFTLEPPPPPPEEPEPKATR
jgi:hypothetical protein